MIESINIRDVYDKPLNFLIGSGASYGLFPTLQLNVADNDGKKFTIESLALHFEVNDKKRLAATFMHYYDKCVRPAQTFSPHETNSETQKKVLVDYRVFLQTVLYLLQRRKSLDTRCNIFTTNYDGCFSATADSMLQEGNVDFVLNDGARGFHRRYLQPRSFNSYLCQTGIFERNISAVPQINLIHVHGSVYWRKHGTNVLVDYTQKSDDLLSDALRTALKPFSDSIMSDDAQVSELPEFDVEEDLITSFWETYKELPIVNPTKWKFHETVFEEHYYHMLRMLSYELEKPNSVLIVFGFSFADEHILSLVKRSLANFSLQVFICCFDSEMLEKLSEVFRLYRNVTFVTANDGVLDFGRFNASTFTLNNASSLTVNQSDGETTT